jgi:serine/threonine protein kinase
MNITDPFILQHDVQLIPCAELEEDVRGRIAYEEGDFTLSRRRGRSLVKVIDGETAALLALFREPRTIAEAVFENSRILGKDPRVWLEELLPHIGAFVNGRILVPAGSDAEQETRPQFESGDRFGRWEIVRCASLIEDSEVYQLRDGEETAALKIARGARLRDLFDNEIAILRHLDGSGIAPRLIESGVDEERPYGIVTWIDGVDATVAAAQRRHDRGALIDLCASIAAAYAALHERGVLHADVHARNVLAVDDGVTLVDFGYSRFVDAPPRVGRAGMYYFYEPELVAAEREGSSMPASAAGEQYAVAALLYLLITGHHYLEFRYLRDEMGRQVETEPPLPFAARGVPPWPEVEQVLFRALEKDPSRRHASMAEMAALLASAREAAARESLDAPLSAEAQALLETTLQSFARGGAMFASRYTRPPTASINFGAAGAAVGMLRIAESRGDAALLALADVWRSRAEALIGTDGAYWNSRTLPRKLVGDVTPYHTESGIHAAAAMVWAAMGEPVSQRRAIHAFIRASQHPCDQLDLTLGRSGTLLAAAMLLNLSDDAALRAFGSTTMRAIWEQLDTRPHVDGYLGIAHGWAGYLYAAMRWCAASGDPLPPRLAERLHALTAMKIDKGRGTYIPTTAAGARKLTASWCHGTAGYVFLYTLAHRLLGDDQWLDLAERCAWNAFDEARETSNLCCGTAGRAYALLHLYKHTGATDWLRLARHLANHAAATAHATAQRAHTLWKGELGVAVLIADLASPETARMPFFE